MVTNAPTPNECTSIREIDDNVRFTWGFRRRRSLMDPISFWPRHSKRPRLKRLQSGGCKDVPSKHNEQEPREERLAIELASNDRAVEQSALIAEHAQSDADQISAFAAVHESCCPVVDIEDAANQVHFTSDSGEAHGWARLLRTLEGSNNEGDTDGLVIGDLDNSAPGSDDLAAAGSTTNTPTKPARKKRTKVWKEKSWAIIQYGADDSLHWISRVAQFLEAVRPVLGDRSRTCRWGGSLVDSVVGTFLTQAVSDSLSSNAFMALKADFPLGGGGTAPKIDGTHCSGIEPVPVSNAGTEQHLHVEGRDDALAKAIHHVDNSASPLAGEGSATNLVPSNINNNAFETIITISKHQSNLPNNNHNVSITSKANDSSSDINDKLVECAHGEILKEGGNVPNKHEMAPAQAKQPLSVAELPDSPFPNQQFREENYAQATHQQHLQDIHVEKHQDCVPSLPMEAASAQLDHSGLVQKSKESRSENLVNIDVNIAGADTALQPTDPELVQVTIANTLELESNSQSSASQATLPPLLSQQPAEGNAVQERDCPKTAPESLGGMRVVMPKGKWADSVDWEAVRTADTLSVANSIKIRGMQFMLAIRIQKFLNKVLQDFGAITLENLRDAPMEAVREYLLSVDGLGKKSVACLTLLALGLPSFPVDTNVGRICSRLGWVPLEADTALEEISDYANEDEVFDYLKLRLNSFSVHTLYELHYHMITLGKVFCNKRAPNCNACPAREMCEYALNNGKQFVPPPTPTLNPTFNYVSPNKISTAIDFQDQGSVNTSITTAPVTMDSSWDAEHIQRLTCTPSQVNTSSKLDKHQANPDPLLFDQSWQAGALIQAAGARPGSAPISFCSSNTSQSPTSCTAQAQNHLAPDSCCSADEEQLHGCLARPQTAALSQEHTPALLKGSSSQEMCISDSFSTPFDPAKEEARPLVALLEKHLEVIGAMEFVASEEGAADQALGSATSYSSSKIPYSDASSTMGPATAAMHAEVLGASLCPVFECLPSYSGIHSCDSTVSPDNQITLPMVPTTINQLAPDVGFLLEEGAPQGSGLECNLAALPDCSFGNVVGPALSLVVQPAPPDGQEDGVETTALWEWGGTNQKTASLSSPQPDIVAVSKAKPGWPELPAEDVSSCAVQLCNNTCDDQDLLAKPTQQDIVQFSKAIIPWLPPSWARNYTRMEAFEWPLSHHLLPPHLPAEVDGETIPFLALLHPDQDASRGPVNPLVSTQSAEYEHCDANTIVNECAELVRTSRMTFLVPCRTALQGSFPLNGTYFQVNEVFVDEKTATTPAHVPTSWLKTMRRRQVYMGHSVISITRGMTEGEVSAFFSDGFICIRVWEPITGRTSALPEWMRPAPSQKHVKFKSSVNGDGGIWFKRASGIDDSDYSGGHSSAASNRVAGRTKPLKQNKVKSTGAAYSLSRKMLKFDNMSMAKDRFVEKQVKRTRFQFTWKEGMPELLEVEIGKLSGRLLLRMNPLQIQYTDHSVPISPWDTGNGAVERVVAPSTFETIAGKGNMKNWRSTVREKGTGLSMKHALASLQSRFQ